MYILNILSEVGFVCTESNELGVKPDLGAGPGAGLGQGMAKAGQMRSMLIWGTRGQAAAARQAAQGVHRLDR